MNSQKEKSMEYRSEASDDSVRTSCRVRVVTEGQG